MSKQDVTLVLPFPPSVNHYWNVNKGGGFRIGLEGKVFLAKVISYVNSCRKPRIQGMIDVCIYATPPDNRRRDLDNLGKAILDSLVKARVIEGDDSRYVRFLCLQWISPPKAPGHVSVVISPSLGNRYHE